MLFSTSRVERVISLSATLLLCFVSRASGLRLAGEAYSPVPAMKEGGGQPFSSLDAIVKVSM